METVLRSANILRHNLPMSLKSGAAALIAACSVALAQPRIRVTSKDGVPISVIKTGSGSPLVMVHGSSSVALSWARVLPELSKNFTLYVMDRRGRKPSGDSADYSPQSEVDDIAAVIAAVGHPVTLLAHSYGALLSVLAATQGDRLKGVSRLILYEPPVYQQPRAERLQEIRKAEQAGDTDRIATLFLSGFLEEKELNAVRASPAWPALVSIAGTLPREVQAVNDVRISAEAMRTWTVPTTMFLGSLTQGPLREAANYVCTSMPNCKLVMLEGQGHMAAQQAPALFVAKVLESVR